MTSNLLFAALDSLASFSPAGYLWWVISLLVLVFFLFFPIKLLKRFRGSCTLKIDILSCFTISLRVDNQALWCIYHGSLLLVRGVTTVQRYGGGLAIAVTGFICWPIPKSRWFMMGIPLFLPTMEIELGSTSMSLNFHSGSTDLKYCLAAVLSVLQRDSPSAVSLASALAALSAAVGVMSLTFFFFLNAFENLLIQVCCTCTAQASRVEL